MTARVDLAQLLEQASEFARQWRMQDGCSALVLDGLATAIEGYVASHTGNAAEARMHGERVAGVIIDDPIKAEVRDATDDEQREALVRGIRQRHGQAAPPTISEWLEGREYYELMQQYRTCPVMPQGRVVAAFAAVKQRLLEVVAKAAAPAPACPAHVELQVMATIAGDVFVVNRSTCELEIVHDDGSTIGLPPSARGVMPSRASVRTPPSGDWTRPRPVSDLELVVAKRIGMAAYRNEGVDFLWVTRLQDGRALFLMPWSGAGVQLSVGMIGGAEWFESWDYHAEHRDAGWRAALSWDGHGEPEGWTRHPHTGRVRPDGTVASERLER